MLDHQLRHQYLNAMGVTSWLPRTQMSGAKTSDAWVFEFLYGQIDLGPDEPDQLDADDANANANATKTVETKASRPVLPVFDEDSKPLKSHNTQASSSAPGGDTQTKVESGVSNPIAMPATTEASLPRVDLKPVSRRTGKSPRFLLNFWAFDRVLIVDSLPAQGYGRISAQVYRKLATNLVRAMGAHGQITKEIQSLGWPMLAGANLDQGVEQARDAVEYKMSKVLNDDYRPQVVLLLGESAVQMVMKRDEALDSLKGLPFSYSSQMKALATLSLTQMLQIPDCKREVWQDIQKVLPL